MKTIRAMLPQLLFFAFGLLGSAALPAADTYPARPIRLVVPYSPGGNTDVLARLIGQHLTQSWAQQVVIDNRPGGNTIIGHTLVARAASDGYTIMLTTLTLAVSPSLYRKLPYDTLKDFTPITLAVTLPNVLVVHPSVPAKSLNELIAHAKANPGKLNFSSSGTGTSPHLSMELLNIMAGVKMVNVPFKGGGPAMTALIAGEVQAQFVGLPAAMFHVESGRLRALAVTSPKRASAAPDIPAIAETVPGYELNPWFGVLGPGGMSAALVERLQGEIARILHSAELRGKLRSLGAEPVGNASREFAGIIRTEIDKYQKTVKRTGISVE